MKSKKKPAKGRAQDRRKVSSERHEIDYVLAKLEREFRPIIKQAILSAKSALGRETGRNQMLVEARRRLLVQANLDRK